MISNNLDMLSIFFTIVIFISIIFLAIMLSNSLERTVKEKKIEDRLLKSLLEISESLQIPVTIKENFYDGNIAAGRIKFLNSSIESTSRIEILEKYSNRPWVLAHELGHYFALRKGDDTEMGADNEGYKLCCAILNDKEEKEIKWLLNIYFNKSK